MQRVSAQRRPSQHQVGSCEGRAPNFFGKAGKSFLAGHKILLTGINFVYIYENIQVVYSVEMSFRYKVDKTCIMLCYK